MFKTTSDGVALVDPQVKYIPIDPKDPPKGKVLLINRYFRQPVVGTYNSSHGFTHYYPLPTFADADIQEAS